MGKDTCATNDTVRRHVPYDLALCILSKMPVKSLKRFGCLHKSWAPLFENSDFLSVYQQNFISSHRSYYYDTSVLLQTCLHDFYSLSGEWYENIVKLDWPNPFEHENPQFYILDSGSISGILCLFYYPKTIVLWNPTTDEFKILPPGQLEFVRPSIRYMVHIHGFGYDNIRDDYNLIRTIDFLTPPFYDESLLKYIIDGILWEVYSLKSNSWRILDVDDSIAHLCHSDIGTRLYLNGICHWFHNSYDDDEGILISFELVNDAFHTTPIPLDISPLDECDSWKNTVLLNESIALISWYHRATTFDILILGELGVKESWTKIFTVGPLSCVHEPIGTGNKGDIFFRKRDGGIVWLDLGSQKN